MFPVIKHAIRFKVLAFLILSSSLLGYACTKKPVSGSINAAAVNYISKDTMPRSNQKSYLALGDSYTIGTSVAEKDRYPVQTVSLLRTAGIDIADPVIIAANGWTTADLLHAINAQPALASFDMVTLLIGVNNQYQGRSLDEYKREFNMLLQTAIQHAGGKAGRVIVLAVPDYSVTPFAQGSNKQKIAAEIDAFNAANQLIAGQYSVRYLDISADARKAAGDPSLVAADGLHFSGKAYAVWSDRLAIMMKDSLR